MAKKCKNRDLITRMGGLDMFAFKNRKSKIRIQPISRVTGAEAEITISSPSAASGVDVNFTAYINRRDDCFYIPILREIELYDDNNNNVYGKFVAAAITSFGVDEDGYLTAYAKGTAEQAGKIIARFTILEIYIDEN